MNKDYLISFIIILLLIAGMAALPACDGSSATPTPDNTPTNTPAPAPTLNLGNTPPPASTPFPTPSFTPGNSPTLTPLLTPTPTPTPTITPTPTMSPTPTPTNTPAPTWEIYIEAVDGYAAEDGSDSGRFHIYTVLSPGSYADEWIEVSYTILGNAFNGIDSVHIQTYVYARVGTPVTQAPTDAPVEYIDIKPIIDSISEGNENVRISLNNGLSADVIIIDHITVTPTAVPQACQADFVGSPTGCDGACTVQFTNLSTGDITGWLWDFGDGHTSTLQNPSNLYDHNGDYTVILTITGPDCENGVTETKADYVHVTGCSG